MGIEMLIKALLAAMGYSKDEFDAGIAKARAEYIAMRDRAVKTEERIAALEKQNTEILSILRESRQVAAESVPGEISVN